MVLLVFKILFTSEALSGRKVHEVHRAEDHALVAPLRHIFLPLRYFVVWIDWVAVGLSVSIYGSAIAILTEALQPRPPIVQPFITLVQIIEQADRPYSGIEWHFPCSMRSKWRHRAGKSALQPSGTPLALLDELHEGRFARGTTRRTTQGKNDGAG